MESIPLRDRHRIDAKILGLADDPRSNGHKKPKNEEGFRVQQGDYQVVYVISDNERMVRVMRIENRKDVYRKRGSTRTRG